MDPSLSTQDLRARNRDYKRDADVNHKWENGEVRGPGVLPNSHGRPAKSKLSALREPRSEKQGHINRAKTSRKRDLHFDTIDSLETTDSSADEETEAASAAPEPDAGCAYSFDHPRGPSQGSQVLGHALAQAVDRFETKATEKLVQDEYLVLDSDGETLATSRAKKAERTQSSYDEDDDYEIL